MSKRRIIEQVKTLLIVFLTLSAALLVKKSGYYDSFLGRLGGLQTPQSSVSGAGAGDFDSREAVLPFSIVISGGEGNRYASIYDETETRTIFEGFAAALGEALGSAQTPEPAGESSWQQSLVKSCVSFDFYYSQPLSLLASWLGTEAGAVGGDYARYIALDCSGSELRLLYRSETDGNYYSCKTAVNSQNTASKLEGYRLTNAAFAFESGKYALIEPNAIVMEKLPDARPAEAGNAFEYGFDSEELFSLLGMNSYVARAYPESDGTQVYVEDGSTIRISPGGRISYSKSSGQGGTRFGSGMTAAAEASCTLVYRLLGPTLGDASLRFAGIWIKGQGYCAEFEYSIGGIPVRLSGGQPAARVTVEGGQIIRLELSPRRYKLGEGSALLLPFSQVSAVLSSEGGGEPVIVYRDNGADAECVWVKN